MDEISETAVYKDALSMVNQGIILLDSDQTIKLWNSFIEKATGVRQGDAVGRNIFEVLPGLDKGYFRNAVASALGNGYKFFFSAAIHGNLLGSKEKLNCKISPLKVESARFLLLEFIDVTDEFIRVTELKRDIQELNLLNQELKKKEQIIKRLAYYDVLTGVPNRTLFYLLADKFIKISGKRHELMAFLFIDVDRFKCINDTYGHIAGDKVIIKVSEILTNTAKKRDIVTRYGGDEFLILLPRVHHPDEINEFVRSLQHCDKKILLNGETVDISLSIGTSLYPYDGENVDQLIMKADSAMYYEKRKAVNM